jgi:hypothetical protein
MKAAQYWNIDNVKSFRGIDVVDGEISMTNSEYIELLDEIYGDVQVCGMTFSSGSLLEDADPTAFRCGKGDHESQIQSELEDQLENEDDSDIEFIDDELTDDEEEEEDE